MTGSLRMLALSDLHGTAAVYDALPRMLAAARPDALVLAGDLFERRPGHASREEAQRACARELAAALAEAPCPVLFLMGNIDAIEWEPPHEHIRPVHGRRVELGGFNFVGYQHSPPFAGRVFVRTEEQIANEVAHIEPLIDDSTVLVTHSPARGRCDRAGGRPVGSTSLRALIDRRRPLCHVFGHIHEAFGRDGIHFNVACAGLPRAVLIELPSLEARTVEG